jgi:hypothetical protein
MWFKQAIRAWVLSIVACVGAWAAYVGGMQFVNGQTRTMWHNMFDVSLAFGSVFAVTAALLYIPAFSVLGRVLGPRLTRAAAVLVGAGLAPAATVVRGLVFREHGDPQTILGWLLYWITNSVGLLVSSVPFAIAGGLFGLFWTWRSHERNVPQIIGRAV